MKELTIVCMLLLVVSPAVLSSAEEVKIASIRVQGNIDMADEEVIALAGVEIGEAFGERTVAAIEERLRRSGKFRTVEVRVRYRSLTGGDAYLVIAVEEKPPIARQIMVSPIIGEEGGYGFTAGATVALVDAFGMGERVFFPATLGGVNRIGAGIDFHFGEFQYGKINNHLIFTADLLDRENPHFKVDDDRTELGAAFSSRIRFVTLTASALWSDVSYDDLETDFWTYGLEAALDTRRDTNLPGDAAYLGLGWKRYCFSEDCGDVDVLTFDLRGYKLLIGQWQLAGQFYYETTDSPIPDYQKPRLGGGSTLRGYRSSEFAGDKMVLSSVELRTPFTGVLDRWRAGMHFFYDNGAVLEYNQGISEADFHHAIGIGTFLFATVFQVRLELAYDLDDYARLHLGSGFRF